MVVTAVPGRNDHYIGRCLETLLATSAEAAFSLRVTLTDNSPGTGIGRVVQARFPGIELIENPERRGYAANHNAALRGSDADYLVVANDDLEFVPGGLARAIEVLERPEHRRVGSAGVRLLNPDGSLQPSTYRFPGVFRILLDVSGLRGLLGFSGATFALARMVGRGEGRSRFWAHDRTLEVDTFRGALAIVRAAAIRDVGWMPETTLLGGEETDWHRRMWNAGWRVLFIHDATAIHHGSQTVKVSPALHAEFLKGGMAFIRRHRGPLTYWALRISLAGLLAVRWLVSRVVPWAERERLGLLARTAWRWRAPGGGGVIP